MEPSFYQIDLTIGRKFWLSSHITIQPFCGLRGHWSSIHLSNKAVQDGPLNPNGYIHRAGSRPKQNLCSLRFTTGLNSACHMSSNWSIFGKAQLSLTYGKFQNERKLFQYIVDTNSTFIYDNSSYTYRPDDFYALLPTIDLAMGIRLEMTSNLNAYRLMFDAGWENHSWISYNQLERPVYINDNLNNTTQDVQIEVFSMNRNLTLSGLTVRGRIEF